VTDHSPLIATLASTLGDALVRTEVVCDELVAFIRADRWRNAAQSLRDAPGLEFDQLIDLCGLDMQGYGDGRWEGLRFAVVAHLLSVRRNVRLRVKVFADDDDFPAVDSVVDVWAGANWFEREAFDLFGIVFPGHPDLRRLLTDYGFVGHPFRKDFPISGFVEMRYDPDQQRVVYQPVSIEPREIVPRVVREEHYGDSGR
jgi:NADH-quinone oxidoreductase subunit C